jgi:predicted DNA repair protein MutK
MIGGAFLCYEGVEKLAHKFLHDEKEEQAHQAELMNALINPEVDLVALEKDKIKGAIRTDFVLSAEIIAITLGTVANVAFTTRVAVLVAIAVIMTIGVYGLVAAIVKIDDAGLYLSRKQNAGSQQLGRALLKTAPYLMKGLSIAGTVAMFLVGGGILTHGIPALHHWIEEFSHRPRWLLRRAGAYDDRRDRGRPCGRGDCRGGDGGEEGARQSPPAERGVGPERSPCRKNAAPRRDGSGECGVCALLDAQLS